MSSTDLASRESILVVLDSRPQGGIDPQSWRIEQVVRTLQSTGSDVQVAIVGPPDTDASSFCGAPVQYTGLALDDWFRGVETIFGVVVLMGGGTAHRVARAIRHRQRQATVVVDTSLLLSLERPKLQDELLMSAELAGRDWNADLRRQRDAELLSEADVVWVRSQREADHVLSVDPGASLQRFGPPLPIVPQADTPRDGLPEVLVLAAPHREFGEPDIDAVAHIAAHIAPALVDEATITVLTERSVPGWPERYPGLNFVERDGPVGPRLAQSAVVVVARPHGATAWAQLIAARAQGVPVVATAASTRGLDAPESWNIDVVDLEQFVPSIRRALRPRRRAHVQPNDVSGDPMASLGLISHDAATTAADWLCTSSPSRRRDLALETYRRSSAEAEFDPDPDPGSDLSDRPLISVLTPVYNTPHDVLDEMIESVRLQVYERWQLCLVDDDSTDDVVRKRCRAVAAADPRIEFVERAENGGIAVASNTALESADGEFIALLDHDDLLRTDALIEVVRAVNRFPDVDMMYSDEDKLFPDGESGHAYAKAAWSPDLHLSYNYTCHFAVFRRSLLADLGGWRLGFDGAQDYDLALRVSEQTDRIVHIPRNLYHWRVVPGSTAGGVGEKSGAWDAGRRALGEAIDRRGLEAEVEEGLSPGTYRVHYKPKGRPKVGVIIPTRDRLSMLSAIVDDLDRKTTWPEIEIMVVDNESVEDDTLAWMDEHDGPVIDYPTQFSYARMMNLAAEQIDADLLLFLNNDVRVTSPDWIEAMVGHAQQRRVGAVGARLMFPDGRVQHEGVVLGVGGVAGNINSRDYFSLGQIQKNCSALTAACLMIRPDVFWEVGGFEERLRVAFNDVDLTARIHQLGYDLVYTPHAGLTHQESASRGSLHPEEDEAFYLERWGPSDSYIDPNYSPRLSKGVQYLFTDEVMQVWMPKAHLAS
jgi:GT2 family glycosyltransferase